MALQKQVGGKGAASCRLQFEFSGKTASGSGVRSQSPACKCCRSIKLPRCASRDLAHPEPETLSRFCAGKLQEGLEKLGQGQNASDLHIGILQGLYRGI